MVATTVCAYVAVERWAPQAAPIAALLVLTAAVLVLRIVHPGEWRAIRAYVRKRRSR